MEVGRFAGVLILHQFASFAPPFFYPHMEDALPAIWYPLRDPRVSLDIGIDKVVSSSSDDRQWSENERRFYYVKRSTSARPGIPTQHPTSGSFSTKQA
jgi:FKBP12-rapamycin complex-associated protein